MNISEYTKIHFKLWAFLHCPLLHIYLQIGKK